MSVSTERKSQGAGVWSVLYPTPLESRLAGKYLFMNKRVSNHITYRYSLIDPLGQERVPLVQWGERWRGTDPSDGAGSRGRPSDRDEGDPRTRRTVTQPGR